jgi:hypothetical protein
MESFVWVKTFFVLHFIATMQSSKIICNVFLCFAKFLREQITKYACFSCQTLLCFSPSFELRVEQNLRDVHESVHRDTIMKVINKMQLYRSIYYS